MLLSGALVNDGGKLSLTDFSGGPKCVNGGSVKAEEISRRIFLNLTQIGSK